MRNKYTKEFIEELREKAKTKTKYELIEWAEACGYIISKSAMEKLLTRNSIRTIDYIPSKVRKMLEAPIGYEKIKNDNTGIIRLKTVDGWKYKHRYIYEQHFGEIPKGYMVIFLDGDRTNFDIDNLFAVKTSDYLVARNKGLLSNDRELNRTALMYGAFYHKVKGYEVDKDV